MLYGLAISQSDCRKASLYQLAYNNLVYFSNLVLITWFTKQVTKFVKRRFQGRLKKFYEVSDWSVEVSVLSFILNFEISYLSFEVRACLNCFDCKDRGVRCDNFEHKTEMLPKQKYVILCPRFSSSEQKFQE